MTPNNYQNSGPDSHLAVSVLTYSDSNLNSDFDGKGLTLWATTDMCNGGGKRAILQSWALQNYSDSNPPLTPCGTYLGCSNPVYNYLREPNTCGPWDGIESQRFLLGANIWQNSIYWLCDVWGCPAWASPSVDSTTPYFRAGRAGVVFVHAGINNTSWTLTFAGVNSYTNP